MNWETLTAQEPRLLRLWERALALSNSGRPFNADHVWFGRGRCDGMKDKMKDLVGWRRKDNPELGTSEAYNIAYNKLYYEALLGEDAESMEHPSTFSTERLPLAIFLHATGRLRFLRCEPSRNCKLRFVFDDPEQIGPSAEFEFDSGAPVAATALFASQKFLRRQMSSAAVENRVTGVVTHGSPQR